MDTKVKMSTDSDTDRIQRSIVINAPRERVWRALTNAEDFGAWFGADLKGQDFTPGRHVRVPNTGCGHEDVWFDVVIDRIEPQDLFSYRWHPFSIDPEVDYSQEERTLVTFTLEDAHDNATLLTVVESGFNKIPPNRRLEAFPMHSQGWDAQLNNVAKHVNA